jgi:superfamily II DNA or RNA helicase
MENELILNKPSQEKVLDLTLPNLTTIPTEFTIELFDDLKQDVNYLILISQYSDNPELKTIFIKNLKIIKSNIDFLIENIKTVQELISDIKFQNYIDQIKNTPNNQIQLFRMGMRSVIFGTQIKTDILISMFDQSVNYFTIKKAEYNYLKGLENLKKENKEMKEKNKEMEEEIFKLKLAKKNIILVDDEVKPDSQLNKIENKFTADFADSDNDLELELELIEVKQDDVIQFKKEQIENKKQEETEVILKDWKWEENQLETFTILEKNGIEIGIHCQATGCGKTYCILKYVGYFIENHRLYPKPNSKNYSGNIILFTERVNILADLFNFQSDNSVDEINKKHWKEIGICDLDKVNVYNRVTIKEDDWDSLLKKNSDKPSLVVINRAYLTRPEMYGELTNKHVGLVLHDECHSSISNQCHNFLLHCIENSIPIVGFSATPLRTTNSKKSNDKNKSKLLEIYGDADGELKLLTNYNMIYACEKKLILEPVFYWYSIQMDEPLNLENRYEIKECHIEAVINILDEVIGNLPNQKIIAWCGTIDFAEAWKEEFENKKMEHQENIDKKRKRGLKFLADYELYLDHSKVVPDANGLTDYDKFKKSKGKSILFCAHKHREGSDIPKLDCCMFLDRCKTRSPIPFIQSIGRVLRKDRKDPNKKRGVIIDGIIDSCDEYAKFVVAKIYGYYLALSNVAGNAEDDTKQEKYLELMDMLEFDQDNDKIKVKLNKDKTTIEINSNQIEWKDLSKKFDSILDEKLTEESREIYKFKMLRKLVRKLGLTSPEEYVKHATLNDLETNPQIIYRYLWKGWYDFLNIDTSIYPETKKLWIHECEKYGINYTNYFEKIKTYKNIPEFPSEIYKENIVLKNVLNFENINNQKKKMI